MDCTGFGTGAPIASNKHTKPLLGIFGGSFDPPHLGHEALLAAAQAHVSLDEIWLIPTGIPVHREPSRHASAAQRLAWLQAVFQHKGVKIVDWEMLRGVATSAMDTLDWIAQVAPDMMPVWLMGSDAFEHMHTWQRFPEHLQRCSVVVFAREGYIAASANHGWDMSKPLSEPGAVKYVNVELPNVSSTMIRKRAVAGNPLTAWVNERIRHEIEDVYERARHA